MTPEIEAKCAYAPARERIMALMQKSEQTVRTQRKAAHVLPAPVRPNEYDPAIAERICERLSEGKNLRQFCVWPAWPTKKTVVKWMKEHPEFGSRYRAIMRARQKASRALVTTTRDNAPARESVTNPAALARQSPDPQFEAA